MISLILQNHNVSIYVTCEREFGTTRRSRYIHYIYIYIYYIYPKSSSIKYIYMFLSSIFISLFILYPRVKKRISTYKTHTQYTEESICVLCTWYINSTIFLLSTTTLARKNDHTPGPAGPA